MAPPRPINQIPARDLVDGAGMVKEEGGGEVEDEMILA